MRLGGGLTRHSRRITRPRPRATISVPRWRPGWHSRPVRQSWAGYGVPVGAGEAVVMPTSTSTDTTTSTPIGRRLAQTVGAGALGLGGSATSRAPGGQSRPLASLRTRQCGAASNPSGGASGVGGAGSPRGCRRGAGRPGGVGGAGGAGLPGRGAAGRPAQRPVAGGQRIAEGQRPGGAFGNMSSGRQDGQFGQRGAQSRSLGQQRQRSVGGGGRGGGRR